MKFVKHLLLTDRFWLRGHLKTGDQRLSTFLNTVPRSFLEMEEVVVVSHGQDQSIKVGRMLLRIEEILLAYEIEAAGDENMRALAGKDRDEISVVLQFGGAVPFQVSGMVSKRVIERDVSGEHDFVVMTDPKIQGISLGESDDHAAWADLPYVIVNRNRVGFISG